MTVIIVIILCGFLVLGFWSLNEREKTREAIERINARKITLDDVMGKNFPAKPNEEINNATVAGVDSNNNAIRDDVERAIFEKYPNSAKIRAAMLQYAQALQLELTEVFNSETLEEIFRKRNHGQSCIAQGLVFTVTDKRIDEVESLVLNIGIRKDKQLDNLKYMTTYSVPAVEEECDISPLSLPN